MYDIKPDEILELEKFAKDLKILDEELENTSMPIVWFPFIKVLVRGLDNLQLRVNTLEAKLNEQQESKGDEEISKKTTAVRSKEETRIYEDDTPATPNGEGSDTNDKESGKGRDI